MTKEEAKTILQCRGNGYSEDEFNEALEIAYSALDSSLPSNLDKASEKYAWQKEEPLAEGERLSTCFNPRIEAFKAGAEWMAGQGETIEGEVVKDTKKQPRCSRKRIIRQKRSIR